jgi:hypothetical protein
MFNELPNVDAILPVSDIARLCAMERHDVYNNAKLGGITVYRTQRGRIAYRVGDVLAVSQLRTLKKLRRLGAPQ